MDKERLDVHLHTTNTCNLHCRHCYNNSGSGVTPADLSSSLLMKVILFLEKNFYPDIHLEGGEIFLQADLLRELSSLPDTVLQNITVTTNGTIQLQDDKVISMLRKIKALRISVEGSTDAQQQAVRGIGLASVLNHARFYLNQGVPVWLRVTLTKQNINHFVEYTLAPLVGMGFLHIQVYEFQPVGRGVDQMEYLAVDCLEPLLEDLQHGNEMYESQIRIMLSRRRMEEVLLHRELLEMAGVKIHQLKPEKGVSIHADGTVYLCPWENDKENSLFNIYDAGWEAATNILLNHPLHHTCNHCSVISLEL